MLLLLQNNMSLQPVVDPSSGFSIIVSTPNVTIYRNDVQLIYVYKNTDILLKGVKKKNKYLIHNR